jgi:uncharacterized delta-60 repeat protein
MNEANNRAGADVITFAPALTAGGPATITALTELPSLSSEMTISGPGADLLTVQRSTAIGTPIFRIFNINQPGPMTIAGLTIANGRGGQGVPRNEGASGAGILGGGTVTLINLVVTGNISGQGGEGQGGAAGRGGDGGGIANFGDMIIINTTVSNNSTGAAGTGGVNCCASGGRGGGIANYGFMTLIDSTISNNHTGNGDGIGGPAGPGGGIFNQGTMTIISSTIADNKTGSTGIGSTGGAGAGIRNNAVNVNLRNTIVANHLDDLGMGSDLSGEFNSQDYNLLESVSGVIITGDTTHNITGVDPILGPLANNGGGTLTRALLPGSPALDAGNNAAITNPPFNGPPFTDQRGPGFNRIIDGPDPDSVATVDIGAYEKQPTFPNLPDATGNEDTPLLIAFDVLDSGSITSITASSSNTTLVPNNPANLKVTGSDSTEILTINPVANLFGSSNITITVNRTGGSELRTFSLTVNSVNDAPSFNKGADQTVSENDGVQTVNGWATNLSTGPANESAQTLSFVVTNNSNPALFAAAPSISSTGTLTYTPATAVSGTATITIALKDNGGNANGGADTSATQSFNINLREGGTLAFSSANYHVAESGGSAVIRISRSGGNAGTASVLFQTSNGSATSADYSSVSQTITFNDGEASKTVNVPITNESLEEPDETVNLTLTNATGSGQLGAQTTALLTIVDDDGANAAVGNLDPTFGLGGKRTTDIYGDDDVGEAVAIQPDGKIVVAVGAFSADGLSDFVLVRYNADGSLDSSFGNGGKIITDFFGDLDVAFGVAIQPDGKIIAVGFTAKPVGNHYETFFALARYNANGTLDTSFGSTGKITTDVLNLNINQSFNVVYVQSAMSVVLQPDGKIVVTGGVISEAVRSGSTPLPLSNFGLARYNTNGTLDSTFGGSGKISRDFFGLDDTAFSVALQADNKIVAAGFATKNTAPFDNEFAWVRYNPDGTPDNNIGNGGRVTTDFQNGNDGASVVVIQRDGKIVLAGFANSNGNSDVNLVRYNVDGTLDSTFANGGQFLADVFGGRDDVFGMALQLDGKIVVAGSVGFGNGAGDFAVARLNSNGTLDQSFGSGGKVTTDFFGGDDFASSVAIQPDGKIVVVGAADAGNFSDIAIARYRSAPIAPPPTIQFNSSSYSVNESVAQVNVTVTRAGDPSGVATVAYATGDTAGANNCSVTNGVASSRCDYLTTIGILTFAASETSKTITIPTVDDSYAEGSESFTITLTNAAGASLGSPASATITITDNDPSNGTNPTAVSSFFVRQHYIDFLNREPEASGLNFWTDQIESCTPKPQCTEIKRINVSAAFFLSIEFQETGYLVYRIYKASYGNVTGTPVPVRLSEFLPDTQQIGQGVVIGQPGAEQQLEANKVAFASDFVSRSRFTTAFPTTLTSTQFVDALFANAAVTPSAADRNAAIAEFSGAGNTADTAARGRALRRVAENSILNQQEKNKAFVLMQYFGYMRRNPNDPPEANLDFGGYNFWLGKLNQFNGNFVDAEMVKAFIVSSEYRQRFGP